MDAIDQTLQATEKLLKALQEDQSTLGDSPFGDRLSDLRTKHKETTDYLNRLWEEESRYHSVPHTTCRQWAVHHCSSERLADTCPYDVSASSRPAEFVIHHRPSEYTIHHRPSEYTIHQRPRGYTEEHRPRPTTSEHHQSDYPGPPRPSEYPVYRSKAEVHESPKSKSSEEGDRASRDQRQSISKTSSRPKASSALPRTSVPTVHPRLRERVNSLPARPIVQDAADVLHLAEKAKAKKREERAREREKEKILEKVKNAISEKPISNGNRSNGPLREGSAPKEKPENGTDEKPAKKKDKVNGHAKEKSSKKKAHDETKDKMKDDSSKRVEFLESEVEEVERTTAENDRDVSSDRADDGGR
ncbi:hypothetical protein COOONC_23927, partial [Cooperia oncophora]